MTNTPRVLDALTDALCDRFDTRYLSLTASTASALQVAAATLSERIGAGSHALISGLTNTETALALHNAGIGLTVVDTAPDGFCINPAAVLNGLRVQTKIVCVSHTLGFPAHMKALTALAREHGFYILQDATDSAGSFGLTMDGLRAHAWGDVFIGRFEAGGVIFFSDPSLQMDLSPDQEISDQDAARALAELQRWDADTAALWAAHDALYTHLRALDALTLHPPARNTQNAQNTPPTAMDRPTTFPFTLKHGGTEAAQALALKLAPALQDLGVGLFALSDRVINAREPWKELSSMGIPSCEALASASLAIPLHPNLSPAVAFEVANLITQTL